MSYTHHYYDDDGVFYEKTDLQDTDYKVIESSTVAYGRGKYITTHYIKILGINLKLF